MNASNLNTLTADLANIRQALNDLGATQRADTIAEASTLIARMWRVMVMIDRGNTVRTMDDIQQLLREFEA